MDDGSCERCKRLLRASPPARHFEKSEGLLPYQRNKFQQEGDVVCLFLFGCLGSHLTGLVDSFGCGIAGLPRYDYSTVFALPIEVIEQPR